ncbi:MAG: TonB-dependent receptor [Flavobacteriaceae bacterium]|nr:TonB-dependent receptor [Flavobacteriaceae bacterium]
MNKLILAVVLLTNIFLIKAQEVKKDSIGTEEVNIVKPYTPKIKDAFKIKKSPVQGNDTIQEKKPVKYAINSAPVASTFVPSKGKAKGVSRKRKENIYDNYVSVGFGNYTTPKIEAFVHTSTTRDNDLGLLLNYHSSNGGVENIRLDNDFIDAKIDLYYKETSRDFDWKVNGGYQYLKHNWYGISKPENLTDTQIDNIDSEQNYNNLNLGGDLKYHDAFFNGVNVDLNVFSDKYNSTESHFLAKPKFKIPISSEWIETDFRLEYIGGKLDKNYDTSNEIKYGYFNLGVNPNFKVLRDNLTINLGVKLLYSGAIEVDQANELFIYPNITASYELIQDVMILYAGLTGDLNQLSYRDFVAENPFVSPTLSIGRTNEQYNIQFGAKGKLASNISYNVNALYKREEGKALYKLNEDFSHLITLENYQYANSFNVVYDNINTLGVFGEVIIDFSKALNFGGNIQFNSFDKEIQEEVWNLPSIRASFFANYNINKWTAGANLFFVGERKDQYNSNFGIPIQTEITNKSYLDLNLNFGYNFTNRLTAFANANNILDANYQKYTGFEVQGIQLLAGIKYKFDF